MASDSEGKSTVRILMVGSTLMGSGDVPLLLMQAFERLGCEVSLISTSEALPLFACVANDIHMGDGDGIRILSFSRYIFSEAVQYHPDVIFIHGSNTWISPRTLRKLQKRIGCKLVIWELNNKISRGLEAESLPIYDYFFVLDSYMVPLLRLAGARNVFHLFACADVEEHAEVDLTPEESNLYGSTLCFVGSAYPERVRVLSELADRDLRVYGAGWDGVNSKLTRQVCSEPVLSITKQRIFSATKISINIQGPHMIHGENFRVFEVAACGGVSFSIYKPDLVSCFKQGNEVIVFEDVEDLNRKIDYYLERPDELEAIGRAARKRVLAEHTYDHRAQTILDRLRQS